VQEALRRTRNDLQAPAAALEPAIEAVLRRLDAQPEVRLARMSGSGATCFALCGCDLEARALAERLKMLQPRWWTAACTLSGSITKP
jgi:4-diphosphocytidyl-2-C-methyl-D-erythritol kinase